MNKTILTRIKARKGVQLFLACFFLSVLAGCNLVEKRTEKLRLAVFPVSTETWAIANRVIDRLVFTPDTLIHPPQWLWQAIDPDSAANSAYLKSFAARIDLDYAVLLDYDAASNRYIGHLYHVPAREMRVGDTLAISKRHNNINSVADRLVCLLADYFNQPGAVAEATIESPQLQYGLARAQKLLMEKAYERALEQAQALYMADSLQPRIRNTLAQIHMQYGFYLQERGKAGRYHQVIALKLCERTLFDIDSTQAKSYRIAARFYLLDKMWGKAESYLVKARNLDPNNAAVYLDFSHLHKNRIKRFGFKNVESLIHHALWLNPCFEEARLYLADYLFFNGWRRQAIKEIKKLLAIHPRSVSGLLFLGKIYVIQGDLGRIMETYNRILEIDPQNAVAYYNLGVYYYNSEDYENAERFFKKAISINNHVNSHLYLGFLYESRGETVKAIAEYRKRIRFKKGTNDQFVDQARKRLFALTKPDTSELNIEINLNTKTKSLEMR